MVLALVAIVLFLSKFVGKDGRIYRIDMTNEQRDIANKHPSFHASKFGHNNVTFIKGNIEELDKVDSINFP